MDDYSEYQFKAKVERALGKVRTILDNTRNPQFPTDVHHEYTDKYLLANFLANSTLASFLSSLEYLGLTGKAWDQVKEWSKTRNVTLRLRADETCKFIKKATREVESDTKNVTKAGILGKFESFTVTKVTEWFWDYQVKWELVAFVGVDIHAAVVLQSRTGAVELKTLVEQTPKPETFVKVPTDVNITWLLHNFDETKTPKFAIDRTSKDCRTPRRNPQVDDALNFLRNFYSWAERVSSYFRDSIFPEQLNHGLDIHAINADALFVPVLPLFEDSRIHPVASNITTTTTPSDSKIPPVFMNSFLAEQARTIEEKRKEVLKIFPSEKLITPLEANLVIIVIHLMQVCEHYSEGVDYIEDMLYKQLTAAIGKEVTPVDFTNYLAFHNRKIFNEEYRPQAFSYAIRRPDHYPEGVLSIEAKLDDGTLSSPITTIVAHRQATHPMHFSLNAATKVAFYGDRYLHGYVSHQFEGYSGTELSLYARARQFSSFILLVGRIVSADLFEPMNATIIQNKDELKIPLLLETIPTPKEFKDAIESLSPEQQRFCKAFRSMQLESTLFGVCIIQIKPQLEKLLKLPDDSLTKEIQLSQDLMNMFIKYQIPSDLISYDGPADQTPDFKTARVKEYVARMNAMLEASKKAELEEARKEQEMRLTQSRNDYIHMYDDTQSIQKSVMYLEEPQKKSKRKKETKEKSKEKDRKVKEKEGGRSRRADVMESMSFGEASAPPPVPSPMPSSMPASTPAAAPADHAGAPATPRDTSAIVEAKQDKPKDLDNAHKEVAAVAPGEVVDYTQIPTQLEQKFEEFDESNALRPTIINPDTTWSKTFYKSLLSEASTQTVDTTEQGKLKNTAFDLLDALTKSGALSVDHASLHVIIASTHCFDKSIIDTVVQDNINPIEKVENSSLIVATTIHQAPAQALITPEHLERISSTSAPRLFAAEKNLIQM